MKCSPKGIFLYLIFFFYQIGPVIDPKMRNLVKNSVIFNPVCFNNDRAITQNTPKCVENCSYDQLLYIYSSTYYQFFCNLDYNSENSVFFGQIPQTNSSGRLCA